jgi:ribonuclease HII
MAAVGLACGVDEAGRGPLAGAVYAAAVILNPALPIAGLADSKKLSAASRTRLAEQIRTSALAWKIASASVEEIDRLNILKASLLAMKRAIEGLSIRPDLALIDGIHCPQVTLATRAIVGGDDSEPCISAASILAKTARDAEMLLLHAIYPCYGFDRHKGYPTALHLTALRQHGPSIIHRRSFAPVRALLNDQASQEHQ